MTASMPASTRAHAAPTGEADLLARLRAGEEAAYADLVNAHGGRMLAVARRFLPAEEDARDAVQEAFIQAWKALPRFAGQAALGTWLHRIAVNACLMKLRYRRSRPEEPIEPLLPQFLDDGHAARPAIEWSESAEAMLARRQVRERVRAAIDRLPESYRTVLVLRDLEELDTAETAAALEISENAVKIRLHRARQALRELIDTDMRGGIL